MSDVKLTSLKSSSLQNSVNAVSAEHPFVYDMEKSTVPVATEMIKINPDSALQSGASVQTLTYRLPASGFLVDFYHKLTHEVGPDGTQSRESESAEGLYAFENFTLTTRDVEIARFHPLGLHAELLKSKNETDFKIAVNLPAIYNGTKNVAGTASYYSPLGGLTWVGARPSDSLDLQFLENVYLNARLRPCVDVKHTTAGANEWTDAGLYMKFVKMLESDYQDYLNANYDENKALTKMIWTHYPENPKSQAIEGVAGNTFSITTDINVPHYVVETVVAVRDKSNDSEDSGSTTGKKGGKRKYFPIKDIKLSANGKNIVDMNDDAMGDRVALQKARKDNTILFPGSENWIYKNGGNLVQSASVNSFMTIDYRLLNRQSSDQENSADNLEGGVSMGALSSKQITVKFECDSADVSDVELLVVHKCVNLVSVDARNGSVSVSTRS